MATVNPGRLSTRRSSRSEKLPYRTCSMEPVLKPKSTKIVSYQALLRLYPFHEGQSPWNKKRVQTILHDLSPPQHDNHSSTFFPSISNTDRIQSHTRRGDSTRSGSNFSVDIPSQAILHSNSLTTTLKIRSNRTQQSGNTTAGSSKHHHLLHYKQPTDQLPPEQRPVRLPTLISPAFTAVFNHVTALQYQATTASKQRGGRGTASNPPLKSFVTELPEELEYATALSDPTTCFLKVTEMIPPSMSQSPFQFRSGGIRGAAARGVFVLDDVKGSSIAAGQAWEDNFLPAAPNTPDSVTEERKPIVRFYQS